MPALVAMLLACALAAAMRLLLHMFCRRRGMSGAVLSAWRRHLRAGQRVLVLSGSGESASQLVALAAASGAEVCELEHPGCHSAETRLPLGGSASEPGARYEVVMARGLLGRCSEETAKSALQHACSLVTPGGVLLVQDLAALPPNPLVCLLEGGLALLRGALGSLLGRAPPGQATHDLAAWLPRDAKVEARLAAGPLHEALAVRRLLSSPDAAVERLRRLHGGLSMAYCTSSAANRVGGAERHIRFHLAERGSGGRPVEVGYVAYVEHVTLGARLRLVLMDPVCAPEDRAAVLQGFLEDCDSAQARPMFACVSSDWTAALQQFGLSATMLGGEVGIPLAQFTLSKDRRRYLRAAPAKGLECFSECYDLRELEELNAAWVGSKASGAEVLIWTWPPSMPGAEAGGEAEVAPDEVRRVFCYQDGRLVGFVGAEPYYRGDGSGEVAGYGLNTIRFLPNLSPPWISDFTVATLIQSLQSEGRAEYLAFGLSPFSELAPHPGDLAWLRYIHQFAWTANLESVYSIQGLAKKKAHHCNGQGVRLHDRFVGACPAHIVGDTVRFVTLLFGDNVSKVPEVAVALGWQAMASAGSSCARLARSVVSHVRAHATGPAARGQRTVRASSASVLVPKQACAQKGDGLAKDMARQGALALQHSAWQAAPKL